MINSKKAYRILGSTLKGWDAHNGFRRGPDRSEWRRALPEGRELVLRFLCDRRGWRASEGHRMTLVFSVRYKGVEELSARFEQLLEAECRDELVERQFGVLSSVPVQKLHGPAAGEGLRTAIKRELYCGDTWLPFYFENDLRIWWTDFLEPRVAAMVARFILYGTASPTPRYPPATIASLRITPRACHDTIEVAWEDVQSLLDVVAGLGRFSPGVVVEHPGSLYILVARGGASRRRMSITTVGLTKTRRVVVALDGELREALVAALESPALDGSVGIGSAGTTRLLVRRG